MCVVIILVILPKRWQARQGGNLMMKNVLRAIIQVLTTPRAFLPVPLAATSATTAASATTLTSGVLRRILATTPTAASCTTATPT